MNPFKTPTPQQVAARQLAETRLAILAAEAEAELAKANLAMLIARESRLAAFARETTE